jgi:hypothetical protein
MMVLSFFEGKTVKIKTCYTKKNKKTHSVEVYANSDVLMDERKWIKNIIYIRKQGNRTENSKHDERHQRLINES